MILCRYLKILFLGHSHSEIPHEHDLMELRILEIQDDFNVTLNVRVIHVSWTLENSVM